MKFDEVNVLKCSKELYRDLEKLNEEVYLEIANAIYHETYPESKRKLNKKWLLLLLASYDSTTKYVYTHEVERKRARFFEALMSTNAKSNEFMNAFNIWWRQTVQYGITISDGAVIEAFKDKGIKYVKWNTQGDSRVCKECKERNGKVYPIDELPEKHYNCRCYFTSGEKDERD